MKKIIFNFICIPCLVLMSCNDLDQQPLHQFTDVSYWTSEDKASSVLAQAYTQMIGTSGINSTAGRRMFDMDRLTDDVFVNRTVDDTFIAMGIADAYNGMFAYTWSDCYRCIKTCNMVLENIDRVPMDATLKERMKAEARFIRASQFFFLTTMYGDIPHFDKQLTLDESAVIGRTAHAEVVTWVRSELNAIASILPTKQQYAPADNGRITKGAAMGLLARTYLYANDWANIASVSKKIIDGEYGTFSLFDSYEGIWRIENEYNSEVMLDINFIPEIRTWDYMQDAIPMSQQGRSNEHAPTQELVDDFVMLNGLHISDPASGYDPANPYVNRDPRFGLSIVYHGYQWKRPDESIVTIKIDPTDLPTTVDMYRPGQLMATPSGYYMRKWWDPTARQNGQQSGLNIIIMRYTEMLLMYAEAMNEQNQMSEQVWNMTIKAIRVRAGFTDPNALDWNASFTQAALREIIRRERRCELVFEGLRLFDIRRWKIAETVMNHQPTGAEFGPGSTTILLQKRTFNPQRDYLWAIPGSQRDINPNLTQNPGW